MGYTTDFDGRFKFNRPLTAEELKYINTLSGTRRMKRDIIKLGELFHGSHGNPFAKDPSLESVYGVDGEYFAHDDGQSGRSEDKSIIDYNTPPGQLGYDGSDYMKRWEENKKRISEGICQPGLWCQWTVTPDGEFLEWDGGEKFYYYVEWLKYLINHFFSKWGLVLNGEVSWVGEDSDSDRGKIIVTDNVIKVLRGEVSVKYREDE